MATLLFGEQPDEFLNELEATPTGQNLLARLNVALDILEADPHDSKNRYRRFANIGCWAIGVEADNTDWLILWEERDEESVIVRAITPLP